MLVQVGTDLVSVGKKRRTEEGINNNRVPQQNFFKANQAYRVWQHWSLSIDVVIWCIWECFSNRTRYKVGEFYRRFGNRVEVLPTTWIDPGRPDEWRGLWRGSRHYLKTGSAHTWKALGIAMNGSIMGSSHRLNMTVLSSSALISDSIECYGTEIFEWLTIRPSIGLDNETNSHYHTIVTQVLEKTLSFSSTFGLNLSLELLKSSEWNAR